MSYYHKRRGAWENLGTDRRSALLRYCEIEGIDLGPEEHRESRALTELQPSNWQAAIFRAAAVNAKTRGLEFAITPEDISALAREADGYCQVTGLRFDFRVLPGSAKRPYSPSLDRIDSQAGYTPDNIRLVCVIVNLAMNEWGLEALLTVGRALKRKRLI